MPSSNKTPFLNLNQWEKTDKFNVNDFNSDNQLVDEGCKKIAEDLESHVTDSNVHINNAKLKSIDDHINNDSLHLTQEQLSTIFQTSESLNTHLSDKNLHITSDQILCINSKIDEHTKNKYIHPSPSKLEKINSTITPHTQDKNVHIDPSEYSSIKAHVKDSKSHVDPVIFSHIKSHTENSKIHFSESTLKKINEHLSNNLIHVDTQKLSNPFYYIGSYVGDGNEQQLIKLPFNPSFVIIFAKNMVPISLAKSSGETVITFGCCTKESGSTGVVPNANGFIVQTTKVYQLNKIAKHLNTSGINYHYIAFR